MERLAGLREVFGYDQVLALTDDRFINVFEQRDYISEVYGHQVKSALGFLRRKIGGVFAAPSVGDMEKGILQAIEKRFLESQLLPHIKRAFAAKSTTAWVGANDATALLCQAVLNTHAPEMAATVSVTGFDDEPAAALSGLTSFNFNIQGVVNTAFDLILNLRRYRRHGRDRAIMVIPGTVIHRRSVRTAKSL